VRNKIVIVNFEKHNPPNKAVSSTVRDGQPLRWVRLMTDWDDDKDIVALPWEERGLWPTLIADGGRGNPRGMVDMNAVEFAATHRVPVKNVRHFLRHLERRGRIQTITEKSGEILAIPVKSGKNLNEAAMVASDHPQGGEQPLAQKRPSYLRNPSDEPGKRVADTTR